MKIKIKRYMLIGTAALALLATSCKDMLGFDSDSGSSSQTGKALETAENINAVAFLSVSLDGVTAKSSSISSRTALPDFAAATGTSEEGVYGGYQYAGFTKFVLYGAKAGSDAAAIGNSEESPIRVWKSHDSVTAYQAFKAEGASKVPIALSSGEAEEWNFTLVGYYGTDETHITFAGSVSKTIKPTVDGFERVEVTQDTFASLVVGLYTKDAANGVFVKLDGNAEFDDSKEYYIYTDSNTPTNPTNGLDFTLARTSKFVYPYSTSGEGKIEITLNYATGSELSGYKTIAKLYSATVSESGVTKSETPLANGLTTTAQDNATERLYSAEGINEGMYVAVFEFTENGVEVGAMTEYVYVLKDLTSKSTLTVDLNGSYAITYRYWILDDEANQNVVVTSAVQDINGKYTFGLGAINTSDNTFPGIAVGSEGNMFAGITSGDNNKISANAGGVVMTYSRLTGATLPTANLFSEDFNSTNPESEYLFCGWYDITGFEAEDNNTIAGLINDSENHTPVLEIKKNTFVHDKTYIAKFVKRVEMPVIDKITITPEELDAEIAATLNYGYKVGYMLTATPSYGENEVTPFTGTATWQWYWSADSENYSFDDEDTVSGTNATIAARDETHVSTYRVEPSKAGKYLQARVVQKYKIEPEKIGDTIAYYKVTENAAVVSGVAKKDVESVQTPVKMALGTLQAVGSTNSQDENALFKMHYGTAATAEVVEIGTQLEASKLHVTSGAITDAHNPNWRYQPGTGNSATVSAYALSLTEESESTHVYAPVGSNYVAVTVSVEGYESLLLPNTAGAPKSAFVSVKYKTPTEANVKSTLWSTADGADALEGIDNGYISFKGTKYSSSETDYTNGETPISVSDIPLSYKVGDGDFTPVTARAIPGGAYNATTDIQAGAVSFKAAEKKVNGEGEPADKQYTDANGNPVGHIAESSAAFEYSFSSANSAAYIGTRQLISYIAVALDGETDVPHPNNQSYTAKVGHTLTVKAYDEHNQEIIRYGAEGLSGITWTWTTADTESTDGKTVTAASTSYTIKQADYTKGTEETHTLTITASRTYAYSTSCEKTLTVSIDKGTMALNGPVIQFTRIEGHTNDKFTVNTTKEDLAAALQLSISPGGLKDSVSEAEVTDVITKFDGTLIDTGSGTAEAKVKFTATGYDDLTPASGSEVYVIGIPLQAAIPADVEASIKLSIAKANISYGYIQFATYADDNGNILGTDDSTSNPPSKRYCTYEMEYTTDDPDTSNSVTWYDMTPDEFAIPSTFPGYSYSGDTEPTATIWVRLKQKGDVGGTTYYYSAGNGSTGAWKTNALETVAGVTPVNSYAASDPIEVTYKNSENGGIRGIASGTNVTFTALDVGKLEFSKENGIVTIKTVEGWTANSWFVDGTEVSNTAGSTDKFYISDGVLKINTENANLLGGTYQITAFVTTEDSTKGIPEVTYSSGASVTVSK